MSAARLRDRPAASDQERGAVLTVTALAMTALMLITALVVDIGYAYQLRRKAQNAADAAALAGVVELPDAAKAVARAREYLSSNGFDGAAATVNTPPLSGNHAGQADCLEVNPDVDSPTFFGKVAGIDSLDVPARAVACKGEASTSGMALFAKSNSCADKTLDISGNEMIIEGGVHSNDDIKISGNYHTFKAPVTYQGSFDRGGTGNAYEQGYAKASEQAWPVDFDMEDFIPGGVHAEAAGPQYYSFSGKIDTGALEGRLAPNGQRLLSGQVLQPGIYYATGDIDLSRDDLRVADNAGVTFVARGKITFSGNGYDMRPYRNDLPVLFTDYGKPSGNCDNSAISFSGNHHAWRGVVFAEWGQIVFSGNEQSTVRGALYGYTLKFSGNESTITYDKEFVPVEDTGALVE